MAAKAQTTKLEIEANAKEIKGLGEKLASI
jgi:hypothetical protein